MRTLSLRFELGLNDVRYNVLLQRAKSLVVKAKIDTLDFSGPAESSTDLGGHSAGVVISSPPCYDGALRWGLKDKAMGNPTCAWSDEIRNLLGRPSAGKKGDLPDEGQENADWLNGWPLRKCAWLSSPPVRGEKKKNLSKTRKEKQNSP
ncbi:hypothetical protein R3P38DRAFT_2772442 [Favolaschia claudopus]|uniref:Uncharacterized protein n=1 Tax=Favolaschia claudopus TaxID=2862362 RepID=A0AAW0C877_9AGAR